MGLVAHAPDALAGSSRDIPAGLEWQRLDGAKVQWTDLHPGRPLIVVFWATWCSVCKKEWPKLVALYDEFEDSAVAPVWAAVSVGEDAAVVSRQVAVRGLVGIQLLDPLEKNFEALGLKYIPHVFVLDAEGTVAYSGRPKVKKLRKVLSGLLESNISAEEGR